MKSIFFQSCYASLQQLIIIGTLAHLFLLQLPPASALNEVVTGAEVGRGIRTGLKPPHLNPGDEAAILKTGSDANAPLLPSLRESEGLPHAPEPENEPRNTGGFRSRISRFWKWLTGSFRPKDASGAYEKLGVEQGANGKGNGKGDPVWAQFWRWLTTDRTFRPKVTGLKLPNMDYLREPFKGPWDRFATMRYNPRPPTDQRIEDIVTVQVLGDKLREDPLKAREMWSDKLKKKGASPLREKILSTDLFFELAKRLSEQQKTAYEYQKKIIQIGKLASDDLHGDARLKFELRRIMKEFPRRYGINTGGVVGTRYDLGFYRRPLSPLLLLKEKPEISEKLADYAEDYYEAVQHFKKTDDTIAAINDYLLESKKVLLNHANYEKEVLNYFENLDRAKGRDFLAQLGQSGLTEKELEEIRRKTFAGEKEIHQQ